MWIVLYGLRCHPDIANCKLVTDDVFPAHELMNAFAACLLFSHGAALQIRFNFFP